MKIYQVCAILALTSTSNAVNIKTPSNRYDAYQTIKKSQLDKMQTTLAQSGSDVETEVETDAELEVQNKSEAEYFLVDDFFVWIWCKITNCQKSGETPQAAPQKEKIKTVEVEKNKTNESNKSNKSNATNSTDDEATPAKKQMKATPAAGANKTAPGQEPTAPPLAGTPEPAPLGPDEDVLKNLKEKKEAQSKEMNAGGVGDSQNKAADDAVNNKKDMTAGAENTLKDETPSQLSTKQAQQQVQKTETVQKSKKQEKKPVPGKSRIVDSTK